MNETLIEEIETTIDNADIKLSLLENGEFPEGWRSLNLSICQRTDGTFSCGFEFWTITSEELSELINSLQKMNSKLKELEKRDRRALKLKNER